MRFYYNQLKINPIRLENIEEKQVIHGFENKEPNVVGIQNFSGKQSPNEQR